MHWRKMKSRKSGGADGLLAEHLKNGGPTLWLKRIFNTIIRLEQIPPSLNLGVFVPVHKGKEHDPTTVPTNIFPLKVSQSNHPRAIVVSVY